MTKLQAKNNESVQSATDEISKNEHLQTKYNELQDLLGKGLRGEAQAKYDSGRVVADVMDKPKRYGEQGVKLLGKAFRLDVDTLYGYANVARVWSATDFKKLMTRTGDLGVPLTFSHLIELSKVKEAKKRDRLIERCLDEGLTVRELKNALVGRRSHLEVVKDDPAESESAESSSVGSISKLVELSSEVIDQVRTIHGALTAIEEEESTENLRELLASAVKGQRELQEACAANLKALELQLERVAHDLDGDEAGDNEEGEADECRDDSDEDDDYVAGSSDVDCGDESEDEEETAAE